MEGLGDILGRPAAAFDSDKLRSGRRTALDGDRGLGATKVARDQGDELFIRLAVQRRRFELSNPNAIFFRREKADARARLDPHLNRRLLRLHRNSRFKLAAAREQ